jgi:hypothetical protein
MLLDNTPGALHIYYPVPRVSFCFLREGDSVEPVAGVAAAALSREELPGESVLVGEVGKYHGSTD